MKKTAPQELTVSVDPSISPSSIKMKQHPQMAQVSAPNHLITQS